jgi:signal transduction histidine kinase/GAF domain-containing protein
MTIRSSDLALLDAIQTAVLLLDRSGRIRAMNRAAKAVLPPDAIGTLLRSHFPSAGPRTIEWMFTPRDEETIVATGIDVTTEERQRIVADFAFSALTEHDPDGLLREACATLRQACGCDCVSVLRHIPARNGFVVGAATGVHRGESFPLVPDEETNLAGYAFRADGPVLYDDLDEETRFVAPTARQLGFLSGVATVINGAYAPFGIIHALSKTRGAFSDRDVQLIQSIALYIEAAMARRAAEDETHRARKELLEREARLRLLVSRLPVIMWSTDRTLTITSIIGAGVQADREAAELQLHVFHLFGELEHDPAEALEGHALTFEVEREARNLRVHIEPLRDSASDVVGTVGFAFDVTEQKRSERVHQELLGVVRQAALEWTETFDSIASPIVLLDDALRVSRLNQAALELAGGEACPDVVGRPVAELQGSLLWKELAEAAREASQLGTPMAVRVTTEDERQWDVIASPWSNAERTTIVASDVTAIARMQERLQRSERMSAVGGLVAGVAHEVRNPLFGISATLDAFEARYGDQQFRTYTANLREQLDRMNDLMHDLLELGRPSPTLLAPGPIASVIAGALSSVRPLATREGVEIRAEVPDGLPEVAMSAQRLAQVFDNLLENAIQHSAHGQAVDIRAWHDEEADTVVVAVEDRGPGFRPEDLGRIFEPFFTLRSGGTGLGLSLVQRIVDDHNGTILARNREDGGASVIVELRAEAVARYAG